MTPESLVSMATIAASLILSVAFLLTVYRVIIGPTLPDRVIALDMLVGIATGFIAVIAIRTGFDLYVDIALSLCLVGFLATVAFARFVLSRKATPGTYGAGGLDGTEGLPATAKSRRKKSAKTTGRRQRK
ncbi:cation:proton antiporter [Agrobacterium bohemicum]|uniref:cation:proton antiporter n=1 Tax=Agrobacterium bohemicum TaxID=2052828 RepID=UPI0009E821C4|nr:cation:proton antiporter [Agrobacterium bohemicum]